MIDTTALREWWKKKTTTIATKLERIKYYIFAVIPSVAYYGVVHHSLTLTRAIENKFIPIAESNDFIRNYLKDPKAIEGEQARVSEGTTESEHSSKIIEGISILQVISRKV